MSKDSRSGGKYTGSHTTLIPLAAKACDIVNKILGVTRISPGIIRAGLKPINGNRRVKFTDENKGCILLSVRDNTSHQEVRVYVTNIQETRTKIAGHLRDADIRICFTKD